MNDLLQSQIQQSCRLAMPEGLKDLMCDISREVLRAQPANLLQFITDYLSALLVTRENLSIASRVCTDLCNCDCHPELYEELRSLGIDEEDIDTISQITLDHFNNGKAQETNIMIKILKRTEIDEDLLTEVQEAIRRAFVRHQTNHTTIYESSSDSDEDVVHRAARHTLKLYIMTRPGEADYDAVAQKIQASYRAYGVRRYCDLNSLELENQEKTGKKNVNIADTHDEHHEHLSSCCYKDNMRTVSSTTLAGSYMCLPMYKPYSVHDIGLVTETENIPEIEHAYINYTDEHPHVSIVSVNTNKKQRKISFEVQNVTIFADDESDSVEEVIQSHAEVEKTRDDIVDDCEVYDAEMIAIDEDNEVVKEEIVNKFDAKTESKQMDGESVNDVEQDVLDTDKNSNNGLINSCVINDDVSNVALTNDGVINAAVINDEVFNDHVTDDNGSNDEIFDDEFIEDINDYERQEELK